MFPAPVFAITDTVPGGGLRAAEPSPGSDERDHVFRRVAGEDPQRGSGAQGGASGGKGGVPRNGLRVSGGGRQTSSGIG